QGIVAIEGVELVDQLGNGRLEAHDERAGVQVHSATLQACGEVAAVELAQPHAGASSIRPISRNRSIAAWTCRTMSGAGPDPRRAINVEMSAGNSSSVFRISAERASSRCVSPDPSSKTTNSSSQDF